MKIADVRVIRADIPVRRPHKMSFTTLEAVNFVFVRLETRGRAGRLGRGGVPGRSDLERGVGGVRRRDRRALRRARGSAAATRRSIEALRLEMARRVQGNPSPARRSRWRSGTSTARALGVPGPSAARRPRARPRAAVVVARRRRSATPRWRRRARRSRAATASSRSRPAAHARGRGRRARARDCARRSGPTVALRVDANQGWDRPTALRAIRALEPFDLDFVEQPVAALGPRGHGRDRAQRGRADHGRRVVLLAAGRARHRAARRASASSALKLTKSAGLAGTHGHRPHRGGGGPDVLRRLHDRDLARHRRLPAGGRSPPRPSTWGCELFGPLLLAGDVVREPVRTPTAASSPSTVPGSASRWTRPPSANGRRAPDARRGRRRDGRARPSRRAGSPSASAGSSPWTTSPSRCRRGRSAD